MFGMRVVTELVVAVFSSPKVGVSVEVVRAKVPPLKTTPSVK